MKSSWEIIATGTSEITEVTFLRKNSLAEQIPYGKHLKQYLPEGVQHLSKHLNSDFLL